MLTFLFVIFYFHLFFIFCVKITPTQKSANIPALPFKSQVTHSMVARCACRVSLRDSIHRREKTFRSNQPTVISSVLVRHRFDADSDRDPTLYFDADPNPDPDWHQNNADPHADPTSSYTHVEK
jgi:hypothetical protein